MENINLFLNNCLLPNTTENPFYLIFRQKSNIKKLIYICGQYYIHYLRLVHWKSIYLFTNVIIGASVIVSNNLN